MTFIQIPWGANCYKIYMGNVSKGKMFCKKDIVSNLVKYWTYLTSIIHSLEIHLGLLDELVTQTNIWNQTKIKPWSSNLVRWGVLFPFDTYIHSTPIFSCGVWLIVLLKLPQTAWNSQKCLELHLPLMIDTSQ